MLCGKNEGYSDGIKGTCRPRYAPLIPLTWYGMHCTVETMPRFRYIFGKENSKLIV